MIYEWRIYEVVPGKMKEINRRFEKYWKGLLEKNGMKIIGFWESIIGRTNTLYYMLAFDDMAHREEAFRSFRADPEVARVKKELEKETGVVTKCFTNILLSPTSYSPMQ